MHLTGIKIKYSLRMFLEVLIFMILDVHARLHAQDFHQKILKKKKNKKQKATQRTLIFPVIGPAHKIKLRRGIRIVYMHLIIHQRLFCHSYQSSALLHFRTLFLLKRRLHCSVAASDNQVRF